MTRSRFDEQLMQLNNGLLEMGAMIESAIAKTSIALKKQDMEQAQQVIDGDDLIDDKEKEIESFCLKLLLQQQPVARDLRFISTALKMITDMERIADQASDISKIILKLSIEDYPDNLEFIPEMADATIKMVSKSIDAFVRKDLVIAQEVVDYDDVVDDLFRAVKSDLIARIRENVDTGEQAIDLLMIAKYFERIGDHAVNIAEWVVFSLTGRHKNWQVL